MLRDRLRQGIAVAFCGLALLAGLGSARASRASANPMPHVSPTPAPQAAVIDLSIISATHAAQMLRPLFPHARIRIDAHANALLVVASPDDLQQMRGVVAGIDVHSPSQPTAAVLPLHVLKPASIAVRLRGLYPNARIEIASQDSLLVRAAPQDLQQMRVLVGALDVSPATPMPIPAAQDAIRVNFANPRTLARALEREVPHLRASVSEGTVILTGTPEDIQQAKTLAQSIDAPPLGARYTQVYRLQRVDATSVGDLVARSYPQAHITVDKALNAISVLGTAAEQARIAAAIAQLDGAPTSGTSGNAGAAYGTGNIAVVDLNSAMPGQNGSPSTTAQDIASAVQQALQALAPGLRITVPANSAQIVLAGSPPSIRLAQGLIARLDRPQPLVVLDTEVLEVDENAAKNIGLQFPGAVVQSQFDEILPTPNPLTGQAGRLIGLQPLTRSPLQFTAELNFLISQGNARVLADPRVTTISGHTATIRAGDTINILTQTAGGIGTPVTQQLQTFNTGVTLDITPMVGPSGLITVALHPVVNSLSGENNGVPQIATRDTQTVVQLQDNQTLVIGGLIQESLQRSVSKLPILGDIPLIGRLFRNTDVQTERNELVIVVTPHVVEPGAAMPPPGAVLPIPTPRPLPTLPPGTSLPTPLPSAARVARARTFATPVPTMTPMPVQTPAAFANTNVFVFGSPPSNTYAQETAAPQIFYVQFSPTLLHNGTPVHVFVITTTNVRKVEVGYSGYATTLAEVAPAKWQGTFNFNGAGLSSSQQRINLTLRAYASSGAAASVQIPVDLGP